MLRTPRKVALPLVSVKPIMAIKKLTSTTKNWMLQARVVRLTGLIPFESKEMKMSTLLKMTLMDVSGSIQAVAFRDVAARLSTVFEIGGVYEIQYAWVKTAYGIPNSSFPHEFEIQFTERTQVKVLGEDLGIPTLDLSVTKLETVATLQPDIMINIDAIVVDMDDVTLTPRKKIEKRDLYIIDESLPLGEKMKLTIWAPECSTIDPCAYQEIKCSSCLVSNYSQMMSLSATQFSSIEFSAVKAGTISGLLLQRYKDKSENVPVQISIQEKELSLDDLSAKRRAIGGDNSESSKKHLKDEDENSNGGSAVALKDDRLH